MRRFDRSKLDPSSALQGEDPAGVVKSSVDQRALHIVLKLRTITPVIGGGVKPWEPDPLDAVRVPSIRGHLRWWWRAMGSCSRDAAQLFEEETRLWGGVTEDDAIRSRVIIQALGVEFEDIKPAGYHPYQTPPGRRPRLRTPPDWDVDSALGYALFPLQCTDEARRAHLRDKPGVRMATRNVIWGARFNLDIRVLTDVSEPLLDRFIHALWLWTSLGGIGARTRRGFGALAVSGHTVTGSASIEAKFNELFAINEWTDFCERVRLTLTASKVRRPITFIESAPCQMKPAVAHGHLVSTLHRFRQGTDIGRTPGNLHAGRSNWPEANTLRVKRGATGYEHQPDPASHACVNQRSQGVPRAGFGLPLEMKFHPDHHGDQQANASIYPDKVQISVAVGRYETHQPSDAAPFRRFASPLLLRPVEIGGKVYPAIVALDGERVETVRLAWERRLSAAPGIPVKTREGAKPPVIETYLRAANGDAIEAFRAWFLTQPVDPNPGAHLQNGRGGRGHGGGGGRRYGGNGPRYGGGGRGRGRQHGR